LKLGNLDSGRAVRAARLALTTLTIIPARFPEGDAAEADLAASRFFYPAVGALVGLILVAVSASLARLEADPPLAAFLLVASWAAISGGFHLDGLADTSDGIFLWGSPERRLTVMRDPHVGSFGVSAIVLVVLGKFAALEAFSDRDRALAVFVAAIVGRSLVLVSAGLARYARPEGTGRIIIEATTPRDALGAAAAILILAAILSRGAGLLAAAATLALAWGLTRLASRKLGGVTGDTLGALVELGEVTFLVVLAIARDQHR
jgi:adenosylcobinamide-GDP ribazoletransferase